MAVHTLSCDHLFRKGQSDAHAKRIQHFELNNFFFMPKLILYMADVIDILIFFLKETFFLNNIPVMDVKIINFKN